ncbi:DUF1345 domain-containing protein [Brevibacterium album]|uniref:DUF1345 domain-containing protein n=1 Tax=Brevibacterium album TaxID=417948 RepID=UPI000429E3B2|nr:DUF1345 domain-containing protein [Brevibacterium album]
MLAGDHLRQAAALGAALVLTAVLLLLGFTDAAEAIRAALADAGERPGRETARLLLRTAAPTAFLVFWVLFAGLYCFLTHRVHSRLRPEALRRLGAEQHAAPVHWWHSLLGSNSAENVTLAASVVSAALVLAIAQSGRLGEEPGLVLLGFGAAAGSWAVMVYSFALRYLRLHAAGARMDFPVPGEPRFGDYLTLSVFVSTLIGGHASPRTRTVWTVMRTHVLLAFAFNTVIVAMTVSLLLAGLAR